MNFLTSLEAAAERNNSLLCVGLDPDPSSVATEDLYRTACGWVDATRDLAAAYKPNLAFWMRDLDALRAVIAHIHQVSVAPVILDAKYGDIGNTAKHYATFAFDDMHADAVTVNAYMGDEAVSPFVADVNKYAFVLVRTTGKFEELTLQNALITHPNDYAEPAYLAMAEDLSRFRRVYPNTGMVAGATDGNALRQVRMAAGDAWLLCPGVGAQGGELEKVVKAGIRWDKKGLLINVARGIIASSNPRLTAEKYRDDINAIRNA